MAQQPNNKKKQASKDASRPVATTTKRTAPTKAKRRSTSSIKAFTWLSGNAPWKASSGRP